MLQVRQQHLVNAFHSIGVTGSRERARRIGVSHTTVDRILAGTQQPGPTFIAGTLSALPHVKFEDLFAVTR